MPPTSGQIIRASRESVVLDLDTVTAVGSTITTVETTVQSVTADLITGETYKVVFDTSVDTSVAGDDAAIRIREDSETGTQLQGRQFDIPSAAIAEFKSITAFYTAVSSGNKTFVGTIVRAAGSGNLTIYAGSVQPSYMYIEMTGL